MIHHVLIIFVKKAKRREKETFSFFSSKFITMAYSTQIPTVMIPGSGIIFCGVSEAQFPKTRQISSQLLFYKEISGHIKITPIRTQHAQFHTISTRLRKVRVCGGVLKVPTGRIGVEVACKYAERLNEVS